ncbi:unnamed protein product [Owenia fusiformis]|uniref:chitin synthase n=1 Tax=Owenia fusiformis TaxID=6347 RepID=A0A8J1UGT8_OWEFU|nr:unnamed protein product [Owenia fusiformis]
MAKVAMVQNDIYSTIPWDNRQTLGTKYEENDGFEPDYDVDENEMDRSRIRPAGSNPKDTRSHGAQSRILNATSNANDTTADDLQPDYDLAKPRHGNVAMHRSVSTVIHRDSEATSETMKNNENITSNTRIAASTTHKWDPFRLIHKEEVDDDQTSQEAMRQVFRFLVYILLFLVVLVSSILSKGALFLLAANSKLGLALKCENTTLDQCSIITNHSGVHDYSISVDVRQSLDPEWDNMTSNNNITSNNTEIPLENVTVIDKIYYTGIVPQCNVNAVRWIWGLTLVACIPYLIYFLRCLWRTYFRTKQKPNPVTYVVTLVMESLHSLGLVLLLFYLFRYFDTIKSMALLTGVAFVPSVLSIFFRPKSEKAKPVKMTLDIIASLVQCSVLITWPVISIIKDPGFKNTGNIKEIWPIPVALFLVSIGWWENFIKLKVSSTGKLGNMLSKIKIDIRRCRSKLYAVASLWKIAVTLGGMMGVIHYDMATNGGLEFHQWFIFGNHEATCKGLSINGTGGASVGDIPNMYWLWAAIWLVQFSSSFVCYFAAKTASKLLMQEISVALPLLLSTPLTIILIVLGCEQWKRAPNFLQEFMPAFVFRHCSPLMSFSELFNLARGDGMVMVMIGWWLSQLWITRHIWVPQSQRLAKTEKLFVLPMFCGVMIEQSLTLNRRKHEDSHAVDDKKSLEVIHKESIADVPYSELDDFDMHGHDQFNSVTVKKETIPKIYVCCTMWHENETEMLHVLKSIFRLDLDQNTRKNAQTYLNITDPDFYTLEAHIFFDDAFETHAPGQRNYTVNEYVKVLVSTIEAAASAVHNVKLKFPPPVKLSTPYGGRLEWRLPGGNTLAVHLKDKVKVKERKRWSQVMYMYMFLGLKLWAEIDEIGKKQLVADNTYLLALDGDVDFRPQAVLRLVDLMKRNHTVGVACGRVHPIGSGPFVWCQKFEYAMKHWLQKSTEHVIGSVLISPGCFSLFRGSALMDDNVIKKFTYESSTEPSHFIQWDQGEDKWLSNLLLQQGYRIEYTAASDINSFVPDTFDELFKQKRRVIPSSLANLIDLIDTAKYTVKKNDTISWPFFAYQMLLLIATILSPTTVLIVIVSSLENLMAVSRLFVTENPVNATIMEQGDDVTISPTSVVLKTPVDNAALGVAVLINVPIIIAFFVVCVKASEKIQLKFAKVLAAVYGIVMLLVAISAGMIVFETGLCNAFTMMVVILVTIFITSGLCHPQEIFNLIHGVIYYMALPCMSMLIVIYSMCNLNDTTWGTREKSVIVHENPEEKMSDTPPAYEESYEGYADGSEKSIVEVTWIDDPALGNGNQTLLPEKESFFFEDLIQKYLKPNNDQIHKEKEEIALSDLRYRIVFGFGLLNAMYFTLILGLQLIKERNVYFDVPCILPVALRGTQNNPNLRLEPIGIGFLLFFGLVLIIQFFGMIAHRFETAMHILSSTTIQCCASLMSSTKRKENHQADKIKQALQTAKELSTLQPDEDTISVVSIDPSLASLTLIGEGDDNANRNRLKGAQKIKASERKQKHLMGTLDAAFAKRFLKIQQQIETGADVLPDYPDGFNPMTNQQLVRRRMTKQFIENNKDNLFETRKLEYAERRASLYPRDN